MTAPRDLRSTIAQDLTPSRPLRPPLRRALLLLPVAIATIVAVPAVYFFRSDFAELGFVRGWGLSLLEAAGGLLIVAAALTESVPGRSHSRRVLALMFAGGLALPWIVLALTTRHYPIGSPDIGWSDGAQCLRTSAFASVPMLVLAAALAARAFATRPGIAGSLYGLGSGVVADAGLRLYCEFSVPPHFIASHWGAVVLVMVAGAAIGKFRFSASTRTWRRSTSTKRAAGRTEE